MSARRPPPAGPPGRPARAAPPSAEPPCWPRAPAPSQPRSLPVLAAPSQPPGPPGAHGASCCCDPSVPDAARSRGPALPVLTPPGPASRPSLSSPSPASPRPPRPSWSRTLVPAPLLVRQLCEATGKPHSGDRPPSTWRGEGGIQASLSPEAGPGQVLALRKAGSGVLGHSRMVFPWVGACSGFQGIYFRR